MGRASALGRDPSHECIRRIRSNSEASKIWNIEGRPNDFVAVFLNHRNHLIAVVDFKIA
jgi:hypothetical protein